MKNWKKKKKNGPKQLILNFKGGVPYEVARKSDFELRTTNNDLKQNDELKY